MTQYISVFVIGAWVILIPLIVGCDADPQEQAIRQALARPVFETEEKLIAYVDSISGIRYFKNEWMKANPNSPLREEDRRTFNGLSYYPIDTDLVFRTRLQTFDDPEIIIMGTTTGDDREAVRYGYIEFTIDGERARLYAYKFTEHRGTELDRYIFIPFKDATSGTETYGGGRYMDVTEDIPRVVLIDFNDAYNPYCVYNDNYSCPIPPKENHLAVAIRAGEKDYVH
jgi:uncharacterized protein